MSSVNFLEKLLRGAEIEWRTLGDITKKWYSGGTPTAGKAEYYENGTIPWLRTQEVKFNDIHETEVNITKTALEKTSAKWIPENCVIIAISGATAGRSAINKIPLTTNQHCGCLEIDNEVALYRYVFHWVCFNYENIKSLGQGARGDLNSTIIKNFRIPIPCPDNPKKSLEIQAEIVRILDAMTAHTAELTSELTSELTARKKQYNYYRDKLLSFEDDVNEFPLSDICTSIADGDHQAPPQTNKGISFVTISNISDNGFIDFSKTKYVPNNYYNNLASKRKPQVGDVLYTVVGSIGIPVFIDFEKEFTFQRHIAILRFKPELVNPKYAFHFMRSSKFLNKANSVAMGAAQKTITLGTLGKLKISLPSLDRQNKVVAILDKFDSLANSITEGLPREIELRQKQYAYYRDLLLSFPQAQAA